ncbi:MAG: hypothetical protein HY586_00710 [Candidatus Omnitrophica bacterium]|nr:hypothetical protein [Candidatus Omnitrophota bacterium]
MRCARNLLSRVWMVALVALCSGCGYTQNLKMPNDIKSLAVPTFVNTIKAKQIYSYQAGLETRLTNAIRDRILFEGNVKLAEPSEADGILIGKLIAYVQEPIGYDKFERVDRYRLVVVTDITLKDLRTNEILWHEPNFTGEFIYNVSAGDSFNQSEAAQKAVEELAQDVVDRTVEDW